MVLTGFTVTFPIVSSEPAEFSKKHLYSPISDISQWAMKRVA